MKTMDKRRIVLAVVLLIALVGLGGVAWGAAQHIRADLKADLAWSRVSTDPAQTQRAERWFPLTYPLLSGWVTSGNSIRANYALGTLVRQGQPWLGWWLEDSLRRNPSLEYSGVNDALIDWANLSQDPRRSAWVQLALTHLDPKRWYGGQFNALALNHLSDPQEDEAAWIRFLDAHSPDSLIASYGLYELFPDPDRLPPALKNRYQALQQRQQQLQTEQERRYQDPSISGVISSLEALTSPSPEQVRTIYASLSPLGRAQLITASVSPESDETGQVLPGSVVPWARILLTEVMRDPQDPQRAEAALRLWFNEDPDQFPQVVAEARQHLEAFLNRDMGLLKPWDQGVQAYVASRFPKSRFAQGCQEYARIRGGDYFDADYGGGRVQTQWDEQGQWHTQILQPYPPDQESHLWQDWLKTYADHPGADDASYWLGRSLEWQGKRAEALQIFADQVVHPSGDADMHFRHKARFVEMLDAGSTVSDLDTWLTRTPEHPLAPLVRYALAVHWARQHRYREALRTSQGLTLDQLRQQTPMMYFGAGAYAYGDPVDLDSGFVTQTSLDAVLKDQRHLWQALSRWEPLDTPDKRYQVATAWGASEGWRIGYLGLFDGSRADHFAYDLSYATPPQRDPSYVETLQAGYRGANHNAVALALLVPLSQDPSTPATLVEKSLYWQPGLLWRQLADYPPRETTLLGELPFFPALEPQDPTDPDSLDGLDSRLRDWYIRQALQAGSRLLERFPRSPYGDDVLITMADITQDPAYLQQLITQFPDGDRVEEARSMLSTTAPQAAP